MNLPNKLTILRIVLVLVIIMMAYITIPGKVLWIPTNLFIMAILFILASVTDTLDGYLARNNNQVTDFGKFLDPIADKILVIAVMIVFVSLGRLPAWIPIIVVFREFVVSGYRLIAVQKNGKVIAASIWGKIKTVTQMVGISLMFIDIYPFGTCFSQSITGWELFLNCATTGLMIFSTIATIFSGYDYLKDYKEVLK